MSERPPLGVGASTPRTVRVGALVPLSRPGWIEAGRHLLAGLELGAEMVNAAGGVDGRPLELIVRDTAADPARAGAAVDELHELGAVALVGEYHSVAARAAACRADVLGLPFLCSSAVIDELTDQPGSRVARLAPAQSYGWRVYGDFLRNAGHRRVALIRESSDYWAAGARVLSEYLTPQGVTVHEIDAHASDPSELGDLVLRSGVSAVLVLVGYEEPTVAVVRTLRADARLADLVIGAPAGQPEFASWHRELGEQGSAIPFLRYLPDHLGPLGRRVQVILTERLSEPPLFMAFEGYDATVVLGEALRSPRGVASVHGIVWSAVEVAGTRGAIHFSPPTGVGVWQWAWAPVQVVDRDPLAPHRFRVLHTA